MPLPLKVISLEEIDFLSLSRGRSHGIGRGLACDASRLLKLLQTPLLQYMLVVAEAKATHHVHPVDRTSSRVEHFEVCRKPSEISVDRYCWEIQ